ncbi:hypothetical protein V1517DRAFT_347971 [Lipomyces orientalis]|uniref:Uncharacterized protein n=1 Tax=Lipomyces orientalis TaxID=1233043 RepID=A0ACC3THK6_9ASCO
MANHQPDTNLPERACLEDDLGDLARQLTLASDAIGHEVKAYDPEPGSHLDPKSPTFDERAWVKVLIRLSETDPQAAPSRFLGVAFKNLTQPIKVGEKWVWNLSVGILS